MSHTSADSGKKESSNNNKRTHLDEEDKDYDLVEFDKISYVDSSHNSSHQDGKTCCSHDDHCGKQKSATATITAGSSNIDNYLSPDLFPFDSSMHKEQRERLVKRILDGPDDTCVSKFDDTSDEARYAKDHCKVHPHSIALLEGGNNEERFETDHEMVFRQESNFHYLFGVKEPGFYGVIELDTGRSVLFTPNLPETYAVWMGPIRTKESYKEEYGVDEVLYVEDLDKYIDTYKPATLLTLHGLNADSGRYAKPAHYPGIEKHRIDNGILYEAIVDIRVLKTDKELKLLRHINKISSKAHLWVMRHTKPNMKEFQQESLFGHSCYFRGGCRHCSYTSICASGENSSILHYGHAAYPNSREIKDGDLCLLDMGAEYLCYASDITCTFPSNGKFTDDQRMIFDAVRNAQYAVMKSMKPGVSYVDMHALAYRTICEDLKKIGILNQDSDIEELMNINMGSVFMPHGLGHFMGIDTHDVGGRPGKGRHPAQTIDGYRSLRCCVKLQPRMVLTVEPGIYFNEYSIQKALNNPDMAKHLNVAVLDRFRKGFGGVRLEDDVIVTDTGIENMTRAPRTVEDVEKVMRGEIYDLNQLYSPFTPLYKDE